MDFRDVNDLFSQIDNFDLHTIQQTLANLTWDYGNKHGKLPGEGTKLLGAAVEVVDNLLGVEDRHVFQEKLFRHERIGDFTLLQEGMYVLFFQPTKVKDPNGWDVWTVRAEAIDYALKVLGKPKIQQEEEEDA